MNPTHPIQDHGVKILYTTCKGSHEDIKLLSEIKAMQYNDLSYYVLRFETVNVSPQNQLKSIFILYCQITRVAQRQWINSHCHSLILDRKQKKGAKVTDTRDKLLFGSLLVLQQKFLLLFRCFVVVLNTVNFYFFVGMKLCDFLKKLYFCWQLNF